MCAIACANCTLLICLSRLWLHQMKASLPVRTICATCIKSQCSRYPCPVYMATQWKGKSLTQVMWSEVQIAGESPVVVMLTCVKVTFPEKPPLIHLQLHPWSPCMGGAAAPRIVRLMTGWCNRCLSHLLDSARAVSPCLWSHFCQKVCLLILSRVLLIV